MPSALSAAANLARDFGTSLRTIVKRAKNGIGTVGPQQHLDARERSRILHSTTIKRNTEADFGAVVGAVLALLVFTFPTNAACEEP